MKARARRHTELTAQLVIGLVVAAVIPSLCAAAPESPRAGADSGSLSLDDRVAAQRALEQVYWSHRTWPKENPGPKPPLSAVLSDQVIRAGVEDALRKSNALAQYGHRITAADLQAELDRMAAESRDPLVLEELFAALGNDATLIGETLVRPSLAERLLRSRYADDEHARGAGTFEAWWESTRATLSTKAETTTPRLTLPRIRSSTCSPDTWEAIALEPLLVGRTGQSAVWTGSEMIVWGGAVDGIGVNTGGRYVPSTNSWTATSTGANVTDGRFAHVAVWTGAVMIVWGGQDNVFSPASLISGGRYDPASDSWMPTSVGVNVPSASPGQTAVWTGEEMIVWGGGGILTVCYCFGTDCELSVCDPPVTDPGGGGRYNPVADAWTPASLGTNAPLSRSGHSAVWSGTEMIVSGGGIRDCYIVYNTTGGDYCNFLMQWEGGRYDPAADAWALTPVAAPRSGHSAVWTGSQMIVWGGSDDSGALNTGARLDVGTSIWTSTSIGTNVPSPRSGHSAIWTGAEMIVWGGNDSGGGAVGSGSRYDPDADTWTPTSTTNLALYPQNHTAAWTGTQMLVWRGSQANSGGLYCACPNGALYYRDADGDGSGDPAMVGSSCDGTIPAGYVTNQADCNDGSASVHSGALEQCNGVDDDCDGTVDDAAAPGPIASLTLRGDAPLIDWTPFATAQSYDVVYGDIATLHGSGGDFTAATRGCITAGTASTTATFITAPAVGEAFWIVARGDNCAGAGTYDSGAPSQAGWRDAGINASPYSCGYQAVCGDGACSPTEGCTDCPGDCGACQCANDSECQPASCCNATSCIPIWEPQSCGNPNCGDGCWICLSACQCQSGACVAVF